MLEVKNLKSGYSGMEILHGVNLVIKQGELVCPRCEHLAVGGQTHPICRRRFGLDGLWSLGVYEGVLKNSIQKRNF